MATPALRRAKLAPKDPRPDNVHSSRVWLGTQPSKKRKAEDQDDDDRPSHKHKNREAPFTGNARPKKRAIHPIKDQVRDLQRLLSKSDSALPQNIRIEKERELESFRKELVNTAAEKERQKMIEKYHMVRFFDRKKAERRLKRATKALRACDDSELRPRLETVAHMAQVDLNYTMYSPLAKPYSALYPTGKKNRDTTPEEDDDEANVPGGRGDREMWLRVESATKEGTLDKLRNEVDLEKARKTLPSSEKREDAASGGGKPQYQDSKVKSKPRPTRGSKPPKTHMRRETHHDAREIGVVDQQVDSDEGGYFDES